MIIILKTECSRLTETRREADHIILFAKLVYKKYKNRNNIHHHDK